ncbi:MAG: biotin/lipoyl-binding protein [Myxococcales bacterium]|nr:biotin/lipoyl-binding protein [Myxococcales bacterium]
MTQQISLPELRPDIEIHPVDQGRAFVVKDPISDVRLELGPFQADVLRHLDGKRTVDEIAETLGDKYDAWVSARDLWKFIEVLKRRRLLVTASLDQLDSRERAKAARRALKKWKKAGILRRVANEQRDDLTFLWRAADWLNKQDPVEAARCLIVAAEVNPSNERVSTAITLLNDAVVETGPKPKAPFPTFHLINPTAMLQRLYQPTKFLFSRWWVAVWVVATTICAMLYYADYTRYAEFFQSSWSAPKFGLFIGAMFTMLVVHEFGHGLAAVHFGGRPSSMGLMLIMYVLPAAYCDVSDAHHFSRKGKVVTAAAGVWITVNLWIVATIGWYVTAPGLLHNYFIALASVSGVVSLFQFVPLLPLDGQHVLAGMLDLRSLSKDATAALQRRILIPLTRAYRAGPFRAFCVLGLTNLVILPLLIALAVNRGMFVVSIAISACMGVSALIFVGALRPTAQRVATLLLALGVATLVFRTLWLVRIAGSLWGLLTPFFGGLGVALVLFLLFKILGSLLKETFAPLKQKSWANRLRLASLVLVWLGIDAAAFYLVDVSPMITGTVRIEHTTHSVSATVEGRVVAIKTKEGAKVVKGQVLVRLENPTLAANIQQAAAETRQCEAKLAQLRRGATAAERLLELTKLARANVKARSAAEKLRRSRKLASVIPREDLRALLDSSRVAASGVAKAAAARGARLAINPALVAAQKAKCASYRAKRERLSIRQRALVVRAPSAGIVTTTRPEEQLGRWVEPGTKLFELSSSMHAILKLEEDQQLFGLRRGLAVRMVLQVGDGRHVKGTVDKLAPRLAHSIKQVERKRFKVTDLPIRVRLVDAPRWVRPGISGTGKVLCRPEPLLVLFLRPLRRFFSLTFWRVM